MTKQKRERAGTKTPRRDQQPVKEYRTTWKVVGWSQEMIDPKPIAGEHESRERDRRMVRPPRAGTQIKQRRESLKKLGRAVEKQWSSIEEAWDKVTMHLPNERSVRELEIPLMMQRPC